MAFFRSVVALLLFSCYLPSLQAQSRPAPQPFDVASVRPHDPKILGATIRIPARGEISIQGMTVRSLIAFAYDLHDERLLGGPKWIGSDKYDIRAKSLEESDPASHHTQSEYMEDQKIRIRLLLADRFGLKLHNERRQEPVYFLTLTDAGLKMPPASNGGKQFEGSITPWLLIVRQLEIKAGRPIIDKTNIKGAYYLRLRYTTLDGHPAAIGTTPDDSNPGPSLFTAVQEQMGLRLQPGKASVDVLVVDAINKPSEN